MEQAAIIEAGRETVLAEAEALGRLADTLGKDFVAAVEMMTALKGRLIISGVGKSGHIARKIAATLSSTGNPAYFVHPTEAAHGDLGMITADDILVLLSKSGESGEFVPLIHYVARCRIPLIAVTANQDSSLARAARVVLALPHTGEAPTIDTPAPTNSTTMMLALGDALAVALLTCKGFRRSDLAQLHPGGQLGAQLESIASLMHQGAAVPLIDHQATVREAVIEMTRKRFGCVGVTEGGRLTGIITDGDLRRHLGDGLLTAKADDIATRAPKTISPDLLCAEAVQIMEQHAITVLFVIGQDVPVGIVHLHDLLRHKVR